MCKFQDFASSVMEVVSEETIDTLNKSFSQAPQGKLSFTLIAYLKMLASNTEWDENLKSQLTSKSSCDHVAFVIKCGKSSDILEAFNVMSKMDQYR
jgi:hypothetical protein